MQHLNAFDIHHPYVIFAVCCVQRVSKGREGPGAANDIDVQLAILRLPGHGSDLLLSLNTPRSISGASSAAQSAGAGQKQRHVDAAYTMTRMLASLTIKDWDLFG
jgi:hypothetical protein